MPRLSRVIIPGVPHHITQRGNRKEQVFYNDSDRYFFLNRLQHYAEKAELDILAYCLMSNHTHFITIPKHKDSLWKALKPLHMCYSQRLNRKFQRTGLNWQGRYFSSPMENQYTWNAIQYVNLNPVEAGLVESPEEYQWSSAYSHLHKTENVLLTADQKWLKMAHSAMKEVDQGLIPGELSERIEEIKRNTSMNLPIGSNSFIRELEKQAGRILSFRPRGRPKKG